MSPDGGQGVGGGRDDGSGGFKLETGILGQNSEFEIWKQGLINDG